MGMDALTKLLTEIVIITIITWTLNNIEKYNADTYSCPEYCGTDHEHILDSQSELDSSVGKNTKFNKIRDLGVK